MNKIPKYKVDKLEKIFPKLQRFFHNLSIEVSKTGEFTIAQYRVLSLIDQNEKLTVNQLKEHLGVAQSSTSGIVERLEQTGYVKKSVNNKDKRVIEIGLTPKAKRLLTSKKNYMNDVYKKMLSALNKKEQDQLMHSFEDLILCIEKIEDKLN